MRIGLIALSALVLVVLAVVVIGMLLPKQHLVSRRASYRATPEELYALIAGPQGWRPDVLHEEAVADDGGRELRREKTRNGETIDYELLDGMPARSIKRRIATENLPYSGSWTFSLQPNGEATTVRITESGEVYNPLFRFVSRFVLGQTRTMDAYLLALAKATHQQVSIQD